MAKHAERPRNASKVQMRITYDVEVNGSVETKELPFVLGVLADLSGKADESLPSFVQRKFAELDRENLHKFMYALRPQLAFRVQNKLTGDGSALTLKLRFERLDDFEPQNVVWQVDPLRKLAEAREKMEALLLRTEGQVGVRERLLEVFNHPELTLWSEQLLMPSETSAVPETHADGPDSDIARPHRISTIPGPLLRAQHEISGEKLKVDDQPQTQRQVSGQEVETSKEELKQRNRRVNRAFRNAINGRIAEIDRLLLCQLNEILHAPEFQRLERTWRGLHYLVHQTKTGALLKIRVCNVSKQELLEDFEDAQTFHESALYQKVYEEEFGTFGGEPYAAVIGDYEFRNHPQDVALLRNISQVAAAAHAPFVAAASPEFFQSETFTELVTSRRFSRVFDSVEYLNWQRFRHSEQSRYIGLVVPRVLMRLPYGPEGHPVESFQFFEDVEGTDQSNYLWGNAVYSFGACLTEAFAKYRWSAALTGAEGGGLVQGLPMYRYIADDGQAQTKGPTEVAISDRMEEELSQLGFIPLVHRKDTSHAVFFSMLSCHKATTSSFEPAEPDADLSNELTYVLATSRFVQYVKAIVRDKMGGFRNKKECEDYLNRWIAQYVMLDDTGSLEAEAQRPLQEARIEVSEIGGRAKKYKAEIFLKPRFQLDERTRLRRTVAELPVAGEG